jgi:hypothetical protein
MNWAENATYKSAQFMKWAENEQRIAQLVKWAISWMGCNIYKAEEFRSILNEQSVTNSNILFNLAIEKEMWTSRNVGNTDS